MRLLDMKRIIIAALMLLITITTAYAIDTPHNANSGCLSCHNNWQAYRADGNGHIDNSSNNMLCTDCHKAGGGAIEKVTHSGTTTSSKTKYGADWTTECVDCHDPHSQKMYSLYKTAYPSGGIIYQSTVAAILQGNPSIYNVIQVAGNPGWAPEEWVGQMVVPNASKSYNYRIINSSSNTLTVSPTLKTGSYYLPVGATLRIAYGKNVPDYIVTPRTITNSSGVTYSYSKSRAPLFLNNSGPHSPANSMTDAQAVCIICHTRTKVNNIGYALYGQTYDNINTDYTNDPHKDNISGGSYETCWSNTNGCHQKPNIGFDAGASCGDCHGNPPAQASELVIKAKIGGSLVDATTGAVSEGAHSKHRLAGYTSCDNCHRTGMVPSDDDNEVGNYEIEMQFYVAGGLYTGGTYKGRTAMPNNFIYNSASPNLGTADDSMTCSNLYCHGATLGDSPSVPAWTDTAPACSNNYCHNTGSSPAHALGSHPEHVGTTSAMIGSIACDNCHTSSSATTHANGYANTDIGLTYSGALYNGAASIARGTVPSGTYGTCQNLYCHSNASPVGGTAAYTSPQWGNTANLNCGSCHNQAGDGSPTWSAAHTEHINTYTGVFDCNDCHSVVADNNTTINATNKAKHVDTVKDVDIHIAHGGSYSGGSCSNVACHSTGMRVGIGSNYYVTQTWNASGQGCDICHRAPGLTAAGLTSDANRNMSSAHSTHIATDIYNYGCNRCHNATTTDGTTVTTKANHANQANNVQFSAGGTYGSASATACQNVYCHSTGADSNTFAAPTWDSLPSGACGTCHGASATSLPASAAHSKHVSNSFVYQYSCNQCHSGIVSVTANSTVVPTISDKVKHVDNVQDVVFATLAGAGSNYTGTNCTNTYCHSDGAGSTSNIAWTAGPLGCTGCHQSGATLVSGKHSAHVGATYGYACYECHSTTVNASNVIQGNHVNGGAINIGFGNIAAGGGWAGANCTVYCHSDGKATHTAKSQAWSGTLDCKGCHFGADTAANMAAASPRMSTSHDKHIATDSGKYGNTSERGTVAIQCDNCHNATTTNNTSISDPSKHVNDLREVSFSLSDWPASTESWTGTNCNNVYCHGTNLSKAFPGGANRHPAWTDTISSCDQCHGFPPGGSHPVDANCKSCHTHVNATNNGFVTQGLHVNGQLDGGGCTPCHGQPPINTASMVNSNATWGETGRNTQFSGTSTGGHIEHNINQSIGCFSCHDGGQNAGSHNNSSGATYLDIGFNIFTVKAGSYDAPNFTNGNYIINSGSGNATVVTTTGPNRTCTNIYCHSNGEGGYATAVWDQSYSYPADCNKCHGSGAELATTTLHPTHAGTTTYNYQCNLCHASTVDGSKNITGNHVNNAQDVAFTGIADAAAGWSGTQCNNTYCHSNGTASTSPTHANLTWTGGSLPGSCTGCHGGDQTTGGSQIVTGKHGEHLNALTLVGKNIGCAECHTATASANQTVGTKANHSDKLVNVKFDNTTDNLDADGPQYNGTSTTGSAGATKAPGSAVGSCTNVYCHSNGNVRSATPTFVSVAWNATIDCADCHGDTNTKSHPVYANGGAGTATANNHIKHVENSSMACTVCHFSTASSNTTLKTSALHMNRVEDVVFDTIGGKTGEYSGTNCNNTYCHGVSGPQWGGAALACNACHDATSTALSSRHNVHYANATSANSLSEGNSHTASAYVYGCNNCHPTATHALGPQDGTGPVLQDAEIGGTNMTAGNYTQGGSSTTDSKGFNYTNGTCNNVYCHSDGRGAYKAPVWNAAATGACNVCHSAPGDGTRSWTTVHDKHLVTYASNTNFDCGECHAATATDNTTINGASGRNNHTDGGGADVSFGTFASTSAGWTGTQCNNTYCHSNGSSATPTHANISWSGTMAADCTSCHSGDDVSASPFTGVHGSHINSVTAVGKKITCTECHNASASNNTTVSSVVRHVNKLVNVKFDNTTDNLDSDGPQYNGSITTGADGATKTAGGAVGSCNNVYCHSNGNVRGATPTMINIAWNATAIDCADCHGDTNTKGHPIYANGGAGTATANNHVKHVENSSMTCDVCHFDTASNNTTLKTGTLHMNRVEDVIFTTIGGKTGSYSGTQTCDNTYCHGVSGPQWGANPMTCDQCHDADNSGGLAQRHNVHYNSATAATSLSGANNHTASAYVYSCDNCHPTGTHALGPQDATGPVFQDAQIGGTTMTAGNYTQGGSSTTDANGYNYTSGTCNNVYCHSDGRGTFKAPVWNAAATGACNVCHSAPGDGTRSWTATHDKHLVTYATNTNITCGQCHATTATNNTTINGATGRTNHTDGGAVDIAFGTFSSTSAGWTGTQCNNTYCHSNGQSTASPTHANISWSGTIGCTGCHDTGGAATTLSTAHVEHTDPAKGNYGCEKCHDVVYNPTNVIGDVTKHINKAVDLDNGWTNASCTVICHGTSPSWATDLSAFNQCTKCHGQKTASPTEAQLAPGYGGVGTDTGGSASNTDTEVGAHNVHVNPTANTYMTALTCNDCHVKPATVGASGHINTEALTNTPEAEVRMNATLITNAGTLSPTYTPGTGVCANTYCHGGNLQSNGDATNEPTGLAPVWNNAAYLDDSSADSYGDDCAQCHGFPPKGYTGSHESMGNNTPLTDGCAGCHQHLNAPVDNNGSGWNSGPFSNKALHVNGIVEATGGACDSCHGFPPDLTDGKAYQAVEGKGAHTAHVASLTVETSYTTGNIGSFGDTAYVALCGACHTNNSADHTMAGGGTRSIIINTTYTFGPTGSPTYKGVVGTVGSTTPKTCSNVKCHYTLTPEWQSY